MFKTETHLHVAEVSRCSKINAADMIKLYSEEGYSTVFIADHLYERYFVALENMSWKEKVDAFFEGYYKAKDAGCKLGVNVIMSAEIGFCSSPNHYLVYGIDEDFVYEYPDLYKMSPESFCTIARERGIFVVQAHPLRDGNCFPTPGFVDAFEVCNTNPRHENFSEKAKTIALENGLYMTSGSDAHRLEDVAKAGVISKSEIKNAEDYINLIKSGKASLIGG